MKPLHRLTAILLVTIGIVTAGGAASVNAAGAGLIQPTASCSASRASVTFTWRPLPGSSQQWLDVSTKDNGFARGTYESEGPMNGSTTSFVWDGLKTSETIYWRINSNTADGWQPSDTDTYTPCGAAAAGLKYVFGTNVSSADQTSVRDAIKVATEYGKEVINFEPSTYTVHAYQDLGEMAEALARWSEDPSPQTIERLKQLYARNVAGVVSFGDGMFIPTWTSSWTGSTTYRYLVIAHEYFHVVQGALRATPERRGTPLWLSEGSAELFGVNVYTRKTGRSFSDIRNVYIREVAGFTESLVNLEAGGRFGATANDSYPLAMLAVEFLLKDRGWKGIYDYYKAIGANVEWHRAFSDSFGVAYDSFATSFENYRQNGYK
jgi:hypothetical protein